MTFSMIGATVIVILTVAALLKRYETRLVLITAGLAMGIISFAPHIAPHQERLPPMRNPRRSLKTAQASTGANTDLNLSLLPQAST